MADKQLDGEIAERRRKQRELKRRFRQRKRDDMERLQEQLHVLEAQYHQLYTAKMAQPAALLSASQHSRYNSAFAVTPVLQQRYEDSKREAEQLRRQLAAMRLRMDAFDRFVSNLDGYIIDLRSPTTFASALPSAPQPEHNGVILTEAQAHAIVQQCYRDICERQWPGRCVSSGSQVLGWRDKRCVDNAAMHFALSKRFACASADAFMEKTWELITSEQAQHMRRVQKTTLGTKLLQAIDKDTLLLQRRVYHAHLSSVTCVNMLAFRMRTPKGYVVGYKSVKLPEFENHEVFEYDAEQRLLIRDDPKLRHDWIDSFHWWVFDEEAEADAESARFSNAAIDQFLSSDSVESAGAELLDLLSHEPLAPAPAAPLMGLSVTIGGVTKNPDANYIGYFLIEIVSCIIRWESVVAASRLTFLDLSTDDDEEHKASDRT